MESYREREYLVKNNKTSFTGFSERSINRLAKTKQPTSILKIESNHIKRDIQKNAKDVLPLLEYQLWLEAGKLDKASFKSINGDNNINYNSNMWRNFQITAGLITYHKNTVNESVASLYPINIPVPSQVGENTLKRYYEQNRNLFKSDQTFNTTMEKVDKEATMMKYLRLKSEMRNPPLDWNGNILPPRNFRKYPSINKNSNLVSLDIENSNKPNLVKIPLPKRESIETISINDQIKIDSTKVKTKKYLPTKLVYRQNHPDFNKVIMEQETKGIKSNSVKSN